MKDDSLKKISFQNKTQRLLFQASWVNWHLTTYPYQAFVNRQQRMMNPQRSETYRVKFHDCVISLWDDSDSAAWRWNLEESTLAKQRWYRSKVGSLSWLWSGIHERTAEQRKASRSKRHLTSGIWPKAGLCKTAKLNKSNKNWGYMHNYGWFTLYGRNKHNTGKEKLNIGCWGLEIAQETSRLLNARGHWCSNPDRGRMADDLRHSVRHHKNY